MAHHRVSDLNRLDPLPAGRACSRCGAALRFSHRGYSGKRRSVPVFRCSGCGLTYRGAERDAAEEEAGRAREASDRRERRTGGATGAPPVRPGRRTLDEGAPDNPVIDEETARRLREQLGG